MSRQSRRYLLVATLLLAVSILRVGASYDPLKDALLQISDPLSSRLQSLTEPNTLSVDQSVQVRNLLLEDELRQLRQQIGSPEDSILTIGADVIRKDVGGQRKSIWINRGSKDGIAKDSAVLSQGFLIGRVISVTNNRSEVVIFGDPSLKVSATVDESNGIVLTETGSVIFDLVPVKGLSGLPLISDGIDGRIPPGLAIGSLSEQAGEADGIFTTYQVLLGVNPSSVRFVQVQVNQ